MRFLLMLHFYSFTLISAEIEEFPMISSMQKFETTDLNAYDSYLASTVQIFWMKYKELEKYQNDRDMKLSACEKDFVVSMRDSKATNQSRQELRDCIVELTNIGECKFGCPGFREAMRDLTAGAQDLLVRIDFLLMLRGSGFANETQIRETIDRLKMLQQKLLTPPDYRVKLIDRVDLARLHWNDTLNFTDLLYQNHPQSILQLLKVAHASRTRQTIEMLLNAVDFAIATNNNNTAVQLLEQQKFYENNTSVWALHNEDGDDTMKGYARFNWCN